MTYKLARVLYSEVVDNTYHQLDAFSWRHRTLPIGVLRHEHSGHFHDFFHLLLGRRSLGGVHHTRGDEKERETFVLQRH